MATKREIQLATLLLKERLERLTGKKVVFKEIAYTKSQIDKMAEEEEPFIIKWFNNLPLKEKREITDRIGLKDFSFEDLNDSEKGNARYRYHCYKKNEEKKQIKVKPFDQVNKGDEVIDFEGDKGVVLEKGIGIKDYNSKLKKYDDSGTMEATLQGIISGDDVGEGEYNINTIKLIAMKLRGNTYVYIYGIYEEAYVLDV